MARIPPPCLHLVRGSRCASDASSPRLWYSVRVHTGWSDEEEREVNARRIAVAAAAAAAALAIAACGGSSSKVAKLNYYIFPEPSGSFAKAASDCSKASGGRYTISINSLPSDSDSQRTQLVHRLAAGDNSIDIVGMDVNWTAEFATAGWIRPWS